MKSTILTISGSLISTTTRALSVEHKWAKESCTKCTDAREQTSNKISCFSSITSTLF